MKSFLAIIGILMILGLAQAATLDIEFPQGGEFSPGEPITFKATAYSDAGVPLNGEITIEIQDSEKRITQTTVQSKEIAEVNLGTTASSGQGVITAFYDDAQAIAFFEVGRDELAAFEIDGNNLVVTNIGNTPYSRTIQITIGDTTGTQTPNLDIGESVSYRLIAPDGDYNLRVTDGKTSLIRSGVRLTGTGNVIGAVDSSASNRAGITGGVSPDEGNVAILTYLKNNQFTYVFIAVIFGATILIAIERRYKKRLK